MSKIAVLTSGGVDSSVALARLAEQGGHDLHAFYLKIWLEDELAFLGSCPWEEDLRYVREICDRLAVPLSIVPLQRAYYDRVVSAAVAELEAGRTPSPDVLCNRLIKFGAFVDAIDPSVDFVASGHHARVDHGGPPSRLLKGADPLKDQTYFLCQLRQDQLTRALFPIGHLTKAQVRAEAARHELPNSDRPDSQGICFLGRVPYDLFVEHHLGRRPGPIRDITSGAELGTHRGFWFHTIGQRKGLGLSGGPWYVVGKDHASNTLWVSHAEALKDHVSNSFVIAEPHWIANEPTTDRLGLRIRHGERVQGCRIERLSKVGLQVTMDEPEAGIAAGQYAVLYNGEECLGGGVIG
ncbi:MAG: tRNA 2-thiouridine(34) synthase MnmA [Thermoanaerobaculales bacterium]|jgi:tRNA-specific 2-thiouridylase|nr:tRNA 2-thiouridine(34) synthase MnmA [Thermoanaerobaculales bacterium]